MTLENFSSSRMNLDGIRTPEQHAQEEADWEAINRIRNNITELFGENSSAMDFTLDTLSLFNLLRNNRISLPQTILRTRGEWTWVRLRHTPGKSEWVGSRGGRRPVSVPEEWIFRLNANSGIGSNQAEYEFKVNSNEPRFPEVTEFLNGEIARTGVYAPSDLAFVDCITHDIVESSRLERVSPTLNVSSHRPE